MEHFYHWCRENFMVINAMKSVICIHGPRPSLIPKFHFATQNVDVKTKYVYLGVESRSDTRNTFAGHYSTRASKSSAAAHSLLHIDAMVESLLPAAAKTLYNARLDPLLAHGSEAMPDTDEDLLKELSEVQVMFIRRSLGVHKRSVLAQLYTETGLIPLRYRRLDFVLRYLAYALERPAETYVREARALTDSMTLAEQSWFMDLQLTVLKLRAPLALIVVPTPNPQAVESLRSKVSVDAFDTLRSELSTNRKLYLIRDRKGRCAVLSPYLQVINADHRYAITRLLLSCHSLPVERLRWVERYREKVPHNERSCRFCQASVETPEHVLLSCEANFLK